MRDVLCVGNAVADAVARPVKNLPKKGKLALVDRIGLFTGGCAVNTAISLSRLGMSTGIVTAVGRDGFGDFILRRLHEESIPTDAVVRSRNTHSSSTMVTVFPDGERSFLHTLGASAELSDRHVTDLLLKKYRAMHLSGFFLLPKLDGKPSARLLERASDLGLLTSLDTCWDPKAKWRPVLQCLRQVDFFMPSIEEAREIFGTDDKDRMARQAFGLGVRKAVILKMGSKGCYAIPRHGRAFLVPSHRVKAVDATGAGDSWDAGFWAGFLRGYDLAGSVRLGNAAGACCVTGMGGSGNVRSFRQVQSL